MLSKQSSLHLTLLRFPLIVGVVFIHAYSIGDGLVGNLVPADRHHPLAAFAQNFLSQGIARLAVPALFFISGYLFFAGFSWSLAGYRDKLRARFRTLVLPFLFWNALTLVIIAIIQAIPGSQALLYRQNAPILGYNLFALANALFGFNYAPIAYQFWFIRDLILLVLLAPLIFGFLRFLGFWPVLALAGLWFFDRWPLYTPSSIAVLGFSAGAYLALKQIDWFAGRRGGVFLVVGYLVLVAADAWAPQASYHPYLHKAGIIAGLLALPAIAAILARSRRAVQQLLAVESASFFVFAAHEPLLNISRVLGFALLKPENSFAVLALYFALPMAVIAVLLLAYRSLCRMCPQLLGIITGGRVAPQRR